MKKPGVPVLSSLLQSGGLPRPWYAGAIPYSLWLVSQHPGLANWLFQELQRRARRRVSNFCGIMPLSILLCLPQLVPLDHSFPTLASSFLTSSLGNLA
jgi:hypothetical protein